MMGHMSIDPDPAVLAYCAGLFDGEGSTVVRQRRGPHSRCEVALRVGMTDREPLVLLQATLGGSLGGPYDVGPTRKPRYVWQLARWAAVERAILLLRPYIVIPRRAVKFEEALQKRRDYLVTLREQRGEWQREGWRKRRERVPVVGPRCSVADCYRTQRRRSLCYYHLRHGEGAARRERSTAKLSWVQAEDVRASVSRGSTVREWADRLNVSDDTIRRIIRGQTYRSPR